LPEEDAYRCPTGERLPYPYTNEEDGKMLRRYWTTACQNCALKSQCTTGPERRITRWEHEHLLEAVQQRLDTNPRAMRQRRETVEHPFGTMKARMGGNTLPHQNASKSSRRDGSLGPRLKSDTGHEHRRYQAADGCDRGLRHTWVLAPRSDVLERPFLHDQDPFRKPALACRPVDML
jgi:macrodomain Ter protein organizer (MatP/YcbG family)